MEVQRDTRSEVVVLAAGLFAEVGYAAASMRTIAKGIGITPAALYYHFADKDALYDAVLDHVYGERTEKLRAVLARAGPSSRTVLERFVRALAELIAEDAIFARLLHRELLDGDPARMRRLSEQVFQTPFSGFAALLRALAPSRDAHLTAISILALILGHYELSVIRSSLPGYQVDHEHPAVLTEQVMALVLEDSA